MTEMTKKDILDRWQLLATAPTLDKATKTPASRVWHFFER